MAQMGAKNGLALCIISIVMSLASAGINPKVCMTKIAQPQLKDFPNIPNNFRADFSWNLLTVNTSFFVQEIFSEDLDLGVMTVENLMGPGIRSKLYTYGYTNEFIFIEDYDGAYGSKCTVDTLSYNDFAFPFRNVNGHDKLVSGKDVLLLGGTSAIMAYIGNDTIDDIDVDVWNACIYLKDTDMTLDATYYFTINNTGTSGTSWTTASGMSSSIKRIHVIQDNANGTERSESTYEYVYFSDIIPTDTDELRFYEPPLGSYCLGRKDNKPLPSVPDYFSMSMELYDPQQHLLIYTDEWYDSTANLSRVDFNLEQDRTNVSQPVKVISDYKTGISYKILKYKDACEIDTISAYGLDDELIPSTKGDKLVRIRTPKEFFNFDDEEKYPWIFEGTHVVRMVECMVWISHRPYPTKNSDVMGYWEWYFTSAKWVLSNGDVVENLEPFRMVVTVPDLDNQVTEFNVYRFNQEPPDDHYFDISACFDMHNQSRSYEFVMIADIKKFNLETNVGMLQYWTVAALEAYAGVRSVRVHGVEFEFDETRIFTRFTILDAPTLKGDVPNPIVQLTLDESEQYLNKSITEGKFLVYYLMQSGQQTQFQVDSNSLVKTLHTGHGSDSIYYVIDDDGQPVTTATTPATTPASPDSNSTDAKGTVTNSTAGNTTTPGSTTIPATLPTLTPQVISVAAVRKDADVSSGGVAAIAIVLLIIGIAIVGLPFCIITARRKKLNDFGRTQLKMSDIQD